MKRSGFSEEQMIAILKEQEAGMATGATTPKATTTSIRRARSTQFAQPQPLP